MIDNTDTKKDAGSVKMSYLIGYVGTLLLGSVHFGTQF